MRPSLRLDQVASRGNVDVTIRKVTKTNMAHSAWWTEGH